MIDPDRLQAAYEKVRAELLAERTPDGHWVGELSSSALSTATAVSALAVVASRMSKVESWQGDDPTFDLRPSTFDSVITRGVGYLAGQQNQDGGFGDTDLSHSNIATTYLVVAALHLAGVAERHADLLARANAYIDAQGGLAGLRKRYGIDKTFVVPIMTNLAIAGLLDWKEIDPLPFELATVPQAWYRFVGMPVVSYAIPALVAIGQAQYFHAPPRNPITRLTRWLSITRSLRVLRRMQPDSGGYLEATPLTSFVVMSLASIENVESRKSKVESQERGDVTSTFDLRPSTFDPAAEVIEAGVRFLMNSVRPDGSWPIDTNLATWNTTLAINALAGAGEDVAELLLSQDSANGALGNALRGVPGAAGEGESTGDSGRGASRACVPTQSVGTSGSGNVLDWLLSCQHKVRHPFTGADPGGFGWTDLSGAVPDADDTPGAILSLTAWRQSAACGDDDERRISAASLQAAEWLKRLQNRDGGWPTFCRGWGRLPFDRSGTDLTAHVIRATYASQHLFRDTPSSNEAAEWVWYLRSRQHPDGSWSPLWFGNQDHPEEDNPVYGTAKVLMAYRDLGLMDSPEAERGVAWLVANQNADGGWGSGVWGRLQIADCRLQIEGDSAICNLQSSIEETALAVEALLAACPRNATEGVPYSAADAPTSDFRPPTSDVRPPAPSPAAAAVSRGLAWLIDRVEAGQHRQPAPIGFYFAKLWYYEKLYPLTFTVAALGRARRQFAHPQLDPAADAAPSRAP